MEANARNERIKDPADRKLSFPNNAPRPCLAFVDPPRLSQSMEHLELINGLLGR